MNATEKVTISCHEDDKYHCVSIAITNDSVDISNSGDVLTITAKWVKERFKAPIIVRH